MTKLLITIFIILAAQSSFGQQFTDLHGDYLGKTPPGDTAVIFAPGIVSIENSMEHCLAVSPKGDEMFFTSGSGWPNSKIMHVKKLGNEWLPAEPAVFLVNDCATQPAFSPDGKYLYFSSSRGKSDIRQYSIWRCKKTGNEWSEPECMIDMSGDLIMEFHPSVDYDGSVYFLRWDFPNQTGDLYMAKVLGDKLAEPVKLNSPINTEFNEVRPSVDPLGRYLMFVSDRPGGFGGKDVYVCYKNPDGTWAIPQNLGPELNTPGDDDVFTISPDSKYWFFEKNNDIYWRESPLNSDDITVTDIDGNVYKTVTIGTQVWMAENLKTTRYRNGDLIGTTNPDTLDISKEINPKYQWAYDGNENNVVVYGRLYTWYAVTDNRNICPVGWHIPTIDEWITLSKFLGESNAGNKLKEAGTVHWNNPNSGATNESGFTALPAGSRWAKFYKNKIYTQMGKCVHYWTSTEAAEDANCAWRCLVAGFSDIQIGWAQKNIGWPVRCIKD